jgi:hypothetical protein
MVTAEKWLSIVENYSNTIWPAQIIFYIVALLITGRVLLKPTNLSIKFLNLYFVVVFAWNGILWYFTLAKDMAGDSYGNYFFGAIFLAVSVLFAIDIFRRKMRFRLPVDGWQRYIAITLLVLVFCYPLLGMIGGHDVSRLMYPGTYPCPTVALGIVMLVTTLPKVDIILYMLLLFLAIPFTPFIQIHRYNVYEDIVLFVSGVYGLIMYLRGKINRTQIR